MKSVYHINNSEIPGELSGENMISSQVEGSPLLRLYKKSRLLRQTVITVKWVGISSVST